MTKVLFIIGSNRQSSFNRQLAEVVEKMMDDQADISYLDYFDLPLMNQDLESPVPAAVDRVRKEIKEADGIWIFSPEYNGSYPGVLKNMLDWMSRPLIPGDYNSGTAIAGKVIAISGVGGKPATANMREKLKELLTFIRANPIEMSVGVSLTPEAWTTNQLSLNDETIMALKAQIEAFLEALRG